jgi:hypothetical protein
MKPFQIFKPGRHTASSGATLDFGEDALQAAVAAYDPALHEAPIVVGHPKDNGPAYGWVKSLSFADGAIVAEPDQLDPEFSEMVASGRYKKRSASWYLPDAPNNPKPGTLYLRHVGFLGAQPPAVKGLKEISFSEDDLVVEFSSSDRWVWGSVASMFRGLRDWLIAEKGLETADRLVPNYLVADVESASKAPVEDIPAGLPAFNEEDPMKIEELQAQVAALTAENATLKANQRPADFAERETSLAAREAAVAQAEAAAQRQAVEARVDAVIAAGRMLPAQKKTAVDFAMGLSAGEATIDFGEGDKAEKINQREAYLRQLEAAPKAVEFGELSAPIGGAGKGAENPEEVAAKARDLVKKAAGEGRAISFTEAVGQVMQSAAE